MTSVLKVLLAGLIQLTTLAGLILIPAGTVHYWQAWVVLAVFAGAAWLPSVVVQARNPAALQRRMRGGPVAESRPVQKIVMAGLYLALASVCVVGGLDRRLGWSAVPAPLCLAGSALFGVGLAGVLLVTAQNHYASTTVAVEPGQRVVSTGLYSVVRHPMYTANVLMLLGLPLALGSYWALVFVPLGLVVLAVRIRDEEQLLKQELTGYTDYQQSVPHRLVPGVW